MPTSPASSQSFCGVPTSWLAALDGPLPWPTLEHQRRGRVVSAVALVVLALASLRGAWLSWHDAWGFAAVAAGAMALSAVVVWGIRRRWSPVLTEHLLVATMLGVVVLIAKHRGGLSAVTVGAIGMLPIMAAVVGGWRSGATWLALTTLAALRLGWAPPDPTHDAFGLDLLVSSSSVVVLSALGWASACARETAIGELTRANEERLAAIENVMLLRQQRLASVGAMAAGVGHEINNPLTYLLSNIDFVKLCLAEQNPSVPLEIEECVAALDDAQAGAERIRQIVSALAELAQVDDRTPRQAMQIDTAVGSALDLVGKEVRYRANLRTDLTSTAAIDADEPRLVQVFIKLLLNAAHALEPSEENTVVMRTWDEDGYVMASVQDTGKGIESADLERIFDPFFKSPHVSSGPGLGLPICHAIVDDLGGSILVTSTRGEGSTFTVRLPAIVAKPPDVDAEDAAPAAIGAWVTD